MGPLSAAQVLHESRVNAPWAKQPPARRLLQRLSAEHSFYCAPHGSNDDWYWMYAAVRAGAHGARVLGFLHPSGTFGQRVHGRVPPYNCAQQGIQENAAGTPGLPAFCSEDPTSCNVLLGVDGLWQWR